MKDLEPTETLSELSAQEQNILKMTGGTRQVSVSPILSL
jgi:hypothetical protein